MVRIAASVAALLSVASSVMGQAGNLPVVNTPTSLVQCQPVAIQYSGGVAPYFISILPGGQVSAAALLQFPSSVTTQAGSYTWIVNLPVGTSVTIAIRDSVGSLNYAQQVSVMAGTDSSCLNSASVVSGVTQAAGSGVTATGPAASSAPNTAASSASNAASSASSSAAGAASSAASAASSAIASLSASASGVGASVSAGASSAIAGISSAASGAVPSTTARPTGAASSNAVNALALVGAAAVALLA